MTEVIAALVGLLAGVLAGMFGVGGGILFVPALLALGLESHVAIGTSLLAIIPAVAAGTWRNARAGTVQWRVVRTMATTRAAEGVRTACGCDHYAGCQRNRKYANASPHDCLLEEDVTDTLSGNCARSHRGH